MARTHEPEPAHRIDVPCCRQLRGVFCDLDDTLTEDGRMVPAAFQALADARARGLRTVIITGRPAGWVDHLARMWPVDGVVGENGGLWFWHDGERMQRRFQQSAGERRFNQKRLEHLGREILARVPGAGLSADQPYRELDLAIDFREDVPPLDDYDIDAIVACFEAAGARCKVSSIHVNGWFGDFDKLSGCAQFLRDRWDESLDEQLSRWIFFGDSANDEPMFEAFPHTVGVANVARFLPRLRHKPTWITEQPGGRGFAEAMAHILEQRRRAEEPDPEPHPEPAPEIDDLPDAVG